MAGNPATRYPRRRTTGDRDIRMGFANDSELAESYGGMDYNRVTNNSIR